MWEAHKLLNRAKNAEARVKLLAKHAEEPGDVNDPSTADQTRAPR